MRELNHNSLDRWICGDNDPNAPFNQPDSEPNLAITDLIEDERFEEAFIKIADLRTELQKLRDVAKEFENTLMFNRLNSIIQKI